MDKFSPDRRQYDPTGEYDFAEKQRRELIDKFEKGDSSAFQKLLAMDLEQLQKQYQTISAQNGSSGGLTTNVMRALFVGVQTKIAGRSFAHWVTNTSAKVALQYLQGNCAGTRPQAANIVGKSEYNHEDHVQSCVLHSAGTAGISETN
jgi:hypothetical protein